MGLVYILSFESINNPNKYIRHRNFLGELSAIQTTRDKLDATFAWDGAFGQGMEGRIWAINNTHHVLRHQNYRIKLVENNQSDFQLFNDSLFIMRPGTDGVGISFESKNTPGFHIYHDGSNLYLGRKSPDFPHLHVNFTFVPRHPLVMSI
ncbi:TPA: AbfB domain-containing protein [Bacillus cereus]